MQNKRYPVLSTYGLDLTHVLSGFRVPVLPVLTGAAAGWCQDAASALPVLAGLSRVLAWLTLAAHYLPVTCLQIAGCRRAGLTDPGDGAVWPACRLALLAAVVVARLS